MGFVINREYLLWISISMGLVALLAGFIVNGINSKGNVWIFYGNTKNLTKA